MNVWDVLQRRRAGEEWQVVGAVKAPDLDMAMLLARESHFRRKEAETYAVRRRGDREIHECPDPSTIGGVVDREYRRSEGYVGVGKKLREIHERFAREGLVIDRPRPAAGARRSGRRPGGPPGPKEEAASA